MNNGILIAIGCLVLIDVILYIAFKTVSERLDVARLKNSEYEYTIRSLKEENSKLKEEMKITAKNRREANEKIDSLHNGDSVSNAINGLCKPSDNNR